MTHALVSIARWNLHMVPGLKRAGVPLSLARLDLSQSERIHCEQI